MHRGQTGRCIVGIFQVPQETRCVRVCRKVAEVCLLREEARLLHYPSSDRFVFVSSGIMDQLGNAVPPLLA